MKFYHLYFIFFILFFLNSCSYKKFSSNFVAKNIDTPIFIQMPKNVLVFENVSNIIYKSLWDYFNCLGYHLIDNDNQAFTLKIKIQKLEPEYKFISQDILVYDIIIKIKLLCRAFDKNKKLLAEKAFCFSTLVSRPKNPVMNSGFSEVEYYKMMRKAATKIEQYFRPYWINKKNENK